MIRLPAVNGRWPEGMDFFRYSLNASFGTREGFLVRLENSSGQAGWGDAAPLEGWSSDTLESVRSCILNPDQFSSMPLSLVCAMEAARAFVADQNEWHPVHSQLRVNALLDGSAEKILRTARSVYEQGCRCFKIKAAGIIPADLPILLSRIMEISGGECSFRIDPNRSWNIDSTLRVAREVREFPVEYFEEPVPTAEDMRKLIHRCPVGIALDETLREIRPEELELYRGATALVLKPTLIGGFGICAEFSAVGQSLGMATVISASYESGVGIYALARFAASLPSALAAGLDTYSRLEDDVLCRRLDFSRFIFQANTPMPNVDFSKLHPL